ncbi:unsaturated chondroitin disaccharide hydrolase [Enterococcus sp. PF1-24]|uniref:glycoside hydrolase family 88 protein n=1 Tax=unclassified Enterococcus TaxID=2608891 RepID=UPI00247679A5|nr:MULTISPECIES: glycoside hydrolase family 88 protein [unclassified Enterococcus]MDH6363963.1 unsaturated chondroitin disaccharide hydrolase [Enterococcus sp. PFB1-1]MDH6401064.1 unsaturated chondroitin disaccharide hydrolase [Enterococcus sp. PF1-24]
MSDEKEMIWLKSEVDFVLEKISENQKVFKTMVIPAASENLVYQPEKNVDWTASFWVGMLFLAKELTDSTAFDETIKMQMESFQNRLDKKIELETHDIGFLYVLSAIADYYVNKNESSKKMAIQAADLLMTRYSEKAQIIQAWGNLDDPAERGRMIIDCLMNLPLLYFASQVTGDEKYQLAAYAHAKQTQKYIVRPNFTTYHTYFFDTETGAAIGGKTAQGYSDESCWARGQAWGIYGFTLSYLHTGDKSFIDTAKKLADYFISKLPADKICYWDLIFNDGSGQERDSSAAAIAACGLLELSRQLPLSDRDHLRYEAVALEIMAALSKGYTTKNTPQSNGILLEGVYDKNSNKGVKECMSWGDYYYVEALTRLTMTWYRYW